MPSPRSILRLLLLLGLLGSPWSVAHAQEADVGRPHGLRPSAPTASRVATVHVDETPPPSHKRATTPAKEADGATLLPHAYGTATDVAIDVKEAGTAQPLPNGGRLWQLRVTVPDAGGLRFAYDRFRLPPGARFFVYDEDGRVVRGAFTARNNAPHGGFATTLTPGRRAMLEYYEPPNADFAGHIRVSTVVRAMRRPYATAPLSGDTYDPSSLACSINTACPEGDPWSEEARATVLIDRGGSTCTGVLLNNTSADATPYILTAHHCGTPAVGDTLDWLVTFNYASPSCTDPATTPPTRSMAGVVVRAAQSGWREDYALLELLNPIPASYAPFYAGWSRVDDAPEMGVTPNHPQGDIRKITFDHDRPLNLGARWLATFDTGTIEGGSSGAPLFNEAHRLVGHVRGAWSIDSETCSGPDGDDNAATVVFPKFAHIWDAGAPDARIADFLDPLNTAPRSLDGRDGVASDTLAQPWISEVDTRTGASTDTDDAEFIEIAGPASLSLDGYRLDIYTCSNGMTTLRSSTLLDAGALADDHNGIGFFVLGGRELDAAFVDQPFAPPIPNRLPDGRGLILLRDPDGREVFDYQYDEVQDGAPVACPASRITRSRGDDIAYKAVVNGSSDAKNTLATTAIGFEETTPASPSAPGTAGIAPSPGRENAQAMPVELLAFDAITDDMAVRLSWTTASETNNAGFEVQARAKTQEHGTAEAWERLGFVEGAGTTTEPQTYTYTARDLASGPHAFRLKQIDVDGTSELSPRVEAEVSMAAPYRLSAPHPNPFQDQASLSLTVAQSQHVRVGLYDVLGRRVTALYDGIAHADESTPVTVDARTLSSGLYVVRVVGEQFTTSRKVTLLR